MEKIIRQKYQLLSMTDDLVQVVVAYLSSNCPLIDVQTDLELILKSDRKIMIVGDFNFDKDKRNSLTKYLHSRDMIQLVTSPTHDEGRTIDHCYVLKNMKDEVELSQYSPYYSDHDALCINLNI